MGKECCVEVPNWNGFHFYPCKKPVKVERDGKWYCTIHDPVYIKQKREALEAKWDMERKNREAQRCPYCNGTGRKPKE